MSRAERRRNERTKKKTAAIYTMNEEQIAQMKADVTMKALDSAFVLMLGLPVMVLHDKYHLLMRKEVDGKGREERFTDLLLDLYNSFNRGDFTLDDVIQTLNEECGIKFEDVVGNRKKK